MVTARWISFPDMPGAVPRTLASRTLSLTNPLRIPVASRADRFITFERPDSSPVIVHADDLLRPGTWVLEGRVAGGELLARVAPAPVLPWKYRLRGPAEQTLSPYRNQVRVGGLSAGAYEVIPVYHGGIAGRAASISIQRGITTYLVLPPESVGAVEISMSDELCPAATSIDVARVVTRRGAQGSLTATQVETRVAMADSLHCRTRVSGLTSGQHTLSVRSLSGELARRNFTVEPQSILPLHVEAPVVAATGRISVNGTPFPDVDVTFFPATERTPTPVTTRTDTRGMHKVNLPGPGEFVVRFEHHGFDLLGNEQEVVIGEGSNVLDWNLEGGTLRIQVNGLRTAPVDVTVTQRVMHKPGNIGDVLRVTPEDPGPIVAHGLRFGEYAIQAIEHDPDLKIPRVAGTRATLEPGQPDLTVNLALEDRQATVSFVDSAGCPIRGFAVWIQTRKIPEVRTGVFSLQGVPAGTTLLATADEFTPICRIVPLESPIVLTATPGRRVAIDFVGVHRMPAARGALSWPGADCAVPVDRFNVTPGPDEDADFVVHNFPIATPVTYVPGPFDPPESHIVVAPDEHGIVRIQLLTR